MSSISDPIADMLTRIRNSGSSKHESCKVSGSKIKKSILEILKEEGFIADFKSNTENGKSEFEILLKYVDKSNVIKHIDRISKPGRRIYIKAEDVKPIKNNIGISILSTSKGIITNKKAKKLNVGGEVICIIS